MPNYDDIINLPHPDPKHRPRMSMYARAAQFAPFAALNGHNAAIQESARLTDRPLELSDQDKAILDNTFRKLLANIASKPSVIVTYFIPDERKEGGRYVTTTGNFHKWDEHQQMIILEDKTHIALRDIVDLRIPQK